MSDKKIIKVIKIIVANDKLNLVYIERRWSHGYSSNEYYAVTKASLRRAQEAQRKLAGV